MCLIARPWTTACIAPDMRLEAKSAIAISRTEQNTRILCAALGTGNLANNDARFASNAVTMGWYEMELLPGFKRILTR